MIEIIQFQSTKMSSSDDSKQSDISTDSEWSDLYKDSTHIIVRLHKQNEMLKSQIEILKKQLKTQLSNTNSEKTDFIYLIKEREFLKTNEPIYKIGMTRTGPTKRVNSYPKGSRVVITVSVHDAVTSEKELIKQFKKCFKQRKEYGIEYFEGNESKMMQMILSHEQSEDEIRSSDATDSSDEETISESSASEEYSVYELALYANVSKIHGKFVANKKLYKYVCKYIDENESNVKPNMKTMIEQYIGLNHLMTFKKNTYEDKDNIKCVISGFQCKSIVKFNEHFLNISLTDPTCIWNKLKSLNVYEKTILQNIDTYAGKFIPNSELFRQVTIYANNTNEDTEIYSRDGMGKTFNKLPFTKSKKLRGERGYIFESKAKILKYYKIDTNVVIKKYPNKNLNVYEQTILQNIDTYAGKFISNSELFNNVEIYVSKTDDNIDSINPIGMGQKYRKLPFMTFVRRHNKGYTFKSKEEILKHYNMLKLV